MLVFNEVNLFYRALLYFVLIGILVGWSCVFFTQIYVTKDNYNIVVIAPGLYC